jgi:methyl-accepting chemotaxis protein
LDILTEINQEKHRKKTKGCLIIVVITAVLLLISISVAIYFASHKLLLIIQENKDAANNLIKQSEQKIIQTAQSMTRSAEELEKSLDALSKSDDIQKLSSENNEVAVENVRKAFQNYKEAHHETKAVFIGTADKEMYLYPQMELPQDYDPTSRSWYTNALNKNGFTWSEPYVDAVTGEAIISLSFPVLDKDELIGVIAFDLNMDLIAEEIKKMKLGTNGYMMITDQNGIVIMHPDKALIGMPIPIDALKSLSDIGDTGLVKYTYQEVDQIAAYSKIDKMNLILIGVIENK